MNHIYRVVFNKQTGTFQAVSETAKSAKKSSTRTTDTNTTSAFRPVCLLVGALGGLVSMPAFSAPTGGQVVAGQANIAQVGNITDINQASQKAVINWQDFGVKSHETVNFKQPNAEALTLNRVIGNNKSVIDGAINANGKVFIQNEQGVLIGKNAQINVGGLVATTAQISNDDFMNGRYQFTNAKGEIENLGNITVPQGGVVALIAPIVKHSGTITASKAHTLLASADSFSITLPDNANFAYTLDKGTLQGLVDNGGAILADGGYVVLTAKGVDSIKKSLIKHTGVIEANTVQNNNGVMELLGDLDHTRLEVSGTLKAEAKGADKGGFVETSASQVKIHDSAVVSTKSENGQSGKWLLDPNDLIVGAGGVMTGQQVGTALENNGDFELRSTNGKADGKGDVIINDEINWNKNTLTINAQNDIHINKTLTGTGTAKLALEYGQGTDNGGESDYYLDKNTPLKDRTVKVNLPEGKNFSVKKGSNGETIVFDVIHKMPKIVQNADGDWESTFTTQNIAFGADIDVSHTKNHEGFVGWDLKNSNAKIHGLGHILTNLYLKINNMNNGHNTDNRKYHIGLFTEIHNELRDMGLKNTNISFNLIGDKKNSKSIPVKIGTFSGMSSANINNIFSKNFKIYTSGYFEYAGLNGVGGLVGAQTNKIKQSFAIGEIKNENTGLSIGGLTGQLVGDIDNSFAEIKIFSRSDGYGSGIGGLTGSIGGYFSERDSHIISNSFTEGEIESIEVLDADGNRGGESNSGGLVGEGYTGHGVQNSYSLVNVNSHTAGGLAGRLYYTGTIKNSYSNGNIVGDYVGGILGSSGATSLGTTYIENSYTLSKLNLRDSKIDKNQKIGGIVSNFEDVIVTSSYFDKVIVGELPYGDQAKTTSEMKQKSTFKDWDFDTVWRIQEGADYPRLRALTESVIVINPNTPPVTTPPTNATELNVQANDLKKVYDSKVVTDEKQLLDIAKKNGFDDIVNVSGLKDGDKLSDLGTLTYGGTWKGAKDTGKYSILPTGLTGGQKYEIKYGEGGLTITPQTIELHGEKEFDNTDMVDASKVFTKRLLEMPGGFYVLQNINPDQEVPKLVHIGDDVRVIGKSKLPSKNSGRYFLDKNAFSLIGEDAKNYQISDAPYGVEVFVSPRSIKIHATAEEKIFDGSNKSFKTPFISEGSLLGDDQISMSQQFESADPKGRYNSIIIPSYIINDGNNGDNYKVYKNNSFGTIMPKDVMHYMDLEALGIRNETNKNLEGEDNIKYDDGHFRIFSKNELEKMSLQELKNIVDIRRRYNTHKKLPIERQDYYRKSGAAIMNLWQMEVQETNNQWKYFKKSIFTSKEGWLFISKLGFNMVDSLTAFDASNLSSSALKSIRDTADKSAAYEVIKRLSNVIGNGVVDPKTLYVNAPHDTFFGSLNTIQRYGVSDNDLLKNALGAVEAAAKIIEYAYANPDSGISKQDIVELSSFITEMGSNVLPGGIKAPFKIANTWIESGKAGADFGAYLGGLYEQDVKKIEERYQVEADKLHKQHYIEIIQYNQKH